MEKGDKMPYNKTTQRTIIICFALILLASLKAFSDDHKWSLEECVNYAHKNNISIKQIELNEKVAEMQLELSQLSILPSISFGASYGRNFGRSINPTTNQFENTTYSYTGINGSSNVLLFGWFRKRHKISENHQLLNVATEESKQIENDIALNVATAYYRILLSNEQILINENQLEVTLQQLKSTETFLKAGRSNGLDLAQIRSQASTDSANYYKSILVYEQALIDIKAILNLDFEDSFSPIPIAFENISLANLNISAKEIYELALSEFPTVKGGSYRLKATQRNLLAAKSAQYPQLSFGASSGTNYSSTYFQTLPNGEVQIMDWGKQVKNNFSQSISIGLDIPIFNNLSSRYAVKLAKIEVQKAKFNLSDEEIKLKQAIYKAYNDAKVALQSFNASKSAQVASAIAFDFAQKRYEKGLVSAIELLVSQNADLKTKVDAASAKYDLVFKLLVIDYYMGKELK